MLTTFWDRPLEVSLAPDEKSFIMMGPLGLKVERENFNKCKKLNPI
jgi:hypothetical protein